MRLLPEEELRKKVLDGLNMQDLARHFTTNERMVRGNLRSCQIPRKPKSKKQNSGGSHAAQKLNRVC